jgi:hypothetical protein
LAHVVDFGDQQVFKGATTYTCLLFLKKAGEETFPLVRIEDLDAWRNTGTASKAIVEAESLTQQEWNFAVGRGAGLFENLVGLPVKLGDVAQIFVGLQTSADTVFLFKKIRGQQGKTVSVYSQELDQYIKIESALLKPVVRSGAIGRYSATATAWVLFPYQFRKARACLISESEMAKHYPRAWAYLLGNKGVLAAREHGKFRGACWYQLYPKNLNVWERPKIMIPYMITRLAAYYDTRDWYFVNVTTGGFGLVVDERYGRMEYFTGLLNSRLLDWIMKRVSTRFHGGYFGANKQFLAQLPMRILNLSEQEQSAAHDAVVRRVERMLELNKRQAKARSVEARARLQRLIDRTDREIDALVYQLYGLTKDEIRIVEEGTA